MGNIDWIPIADMPEAFKDGRDVLLWIPDILGWDDRPGAVSVYWDGGMGWSSNVLGGFTPRGNPTHFAEINPPA